MSQSNRPEVEWARQLANGNSDAFVNFVESFQTKIFQYTWLMCGQREDAEEVAQDTLLKVFESFDQLRDPEKVRSWVFRIAKNYCLMKRRKSLFAPSHEISLDADHGLPMDIADLSEHPEEQVMRTEMGRELERALRELPDAYRTVVLLRDMEGLSTAETAELLDISDDAVKQRLHRARGMLRKNLAGYFVGERPSPLPADLREAMRRAYEGCINCG